MDSIEIKQLGNSEVEISGEVPAAEFEKHRAAAVKKLGENADVPGFRKGHVPDHVLARHVGEDAVLMEMAERTIQEWYPKVVIEKGIQAIGRPEITITKIAAGNPLGFKAKTAVLPEVILPENYKNIGKEIAREPEEDTIVTDEEMEKTIEQIRKNWAQQEAGKNAERTDGNNNDNDDDHDNDNDSGAILGPDGKPIRRNDDRGHDNDNDHDHVRTDAEQSSATSNGASHDGGGEEKLPELTDEWVKKLGKFESVADFRQKIRENLKAEKKQREKEKKRVKLIEKLVEGTKIDVPMVLIEHEKERILAQFKDQIAMAGMNPDDYFKQSGKSEEEAKKELGADAEKRVKTQLILAKIAEEENIKVPPEEVEKEIARLREQYQGAPEEKIRAYVENVMANEKVFSVLEGEAQDGAE